MDIQTIMPEPIMPDELLDFEKRDLFVRITKYVGKALNVLVMDIGWKQREIEKAFGVSGSLVTVYGNYEKYERKISMEDFRKCLMANIVTMENVIKNCAENEKEIKFLQEFKYET